MKYYLANNDLPGPRVRVNMPFNFWANSLPSNRITDPILCNFKMKLSTSIYDLARINVCHFHHHFQWQLLNFGVYWDTRAYILGLESKNFSIYMGYGLYLIFITQTGETRMYFLTYWKLILQFTILNYLAFINVLWTLLSSYQIEVASIGLNIYKLSVNPLEMWTYQTVYG